MTRYVIGILVVGLLAFGGWAVAQQDRPGPKAPAPEGGPFVVSPAGQSAVLLDTKSGKTWVLTQSVEGHSVWLPARRIDVEEEALRWQEREKKVKAIQAERNKAEKEMGPTKDNWRYEVATILEPAADLAVYRIRVWTTDKRAVYVDLGGITLEGATRPESDGTGHRADVFIVVGLERSERGAGKQLERRIRFDAGAGASVDDADDVPADSVLAKLIKMKGTLGKEALGKKVIVGELHRKELRVGVE
jgi:hypothetical protein